MTERCVAILGWRDEPTDAVEEYCQYLSEGLKDCGIQLEQIRVPWPEVGWHAAMQHLPETTRDLQKTWFLLQYTALGWSRRGFPLRVLGVIRALKENGGRCAIVFHDTCPYFGNRLVDKFRRAVQLYTMRKAMRLADLTVLTVPRSQMSWISEGMSNVIFIPVGANLPNPEMAWQFKRERGTEIPTVAVFSFSPGAVGSEEVGRIAEAMRYASRKIGPLRLVVLGRNSEIGGKQLQQELAACQVEVVIHGLLRLKL